MWCDDLGYTRLATEQEWTAAKLAVGLRPETSCPPVYIHENVPEEDAVALYKMRPRSEYHFSGYTMNCGPSSLIALRKGVAPGVLEHEMIHAALGCKFDTWADGDHTLPVWEEQHD